MTEKKSTVLKLDDYDEDRHSSKPATYENTYRSGKRTTKSKETRKTASEIKFEDSPQVMKETDGPV